MRVVVGNLSRNDIKKPKPKEEKKEDKTDGKE